MTTLLIHHAVLEHPETAPSYNTYQRAHWAKQRKIKQHWQGVFESLLMLSKVPRHTFTRCTVEADLRFPVHRRRDEGNFRTGLEKACGDALVSGGWIPDDDHDRFEFRSVTFLEPGPPLTRLRLVFEAPEGTDG